jgi:DNA-directed RNA polymerase subunit RPC12/RpoP
MIRTRTYYCSDCSKTIDFKSNESHVCECGHVFGVKFNNTKNHVNMRTTWSGQTQVEFSQTTMDQDIAERNAR